MVVDQLTAPVTHTIQPDDDDSAMFDDDIALDEIDLSALLTHPKGLEPSDSDIFDDIPQEAFEQILDPPTTPTSTTSTLVTDNEGSDRLSRASSGSTMVANETEIKERPKVRERKGQGRHGLKREGLFSPIEPKEIHSISGSQHDDRKIPEKRRRVNREGPHAPSRRREYRNDGEATRRVVPDDGRGRQRGPYPTDSQPDRNHGRPARKFHHCPS